MLTNHSPKKTEENQMTKLSEAALTYEPPVTRMVSELAEVDVSAEIKEKTVKEGTKDEFTYKYIEVKGEEYRVGASVLKQLKAQLESNPNLSKFKVTKEGKGLQSEYTVIPL